MLTLPLLFDIISFVVRNGELNMREWRNRQTRTFEGRVVIPYGFKSRLSHHGGFLRVPAKLIGD